MSMVTRPAIALLAAVAASALLLSCAAEDDTDGAAKTGATAAKTAATTVAKSTVAGPNTSAGKAAGTIGVELAEWSVRAGEPGRAGQIEFNVRNNGTIPHELVVLKTDEDAASLTKDASARVDESKYPPVGRTKEINGGASETLRASLTAGKYVLLCNISGHYDLGMRMGFTVN